MRFGLFTSILLSVASSTFAFPAQTQTPLLQHANNNDTSISVKLFNELEELARIVDISYCVGTAGLGIQKPFQCVSRCVEFENFELVTTWNTGPLLSDSCGYIALSHPPSPPRIILAFRGTYSLANTIVDLSTIPQEYVPYPGDGDDEDDPTPSPPVSSSLPPFNPSDGDTPPAHPPKCTNCTVHTGFYTSWLHTRQEILVHLTEAIDKYPSYTLTLVGHSLGGAVAALAGLDLLARGWDPHVTTFGEPRVGNKPLMAYIDARFHTNHTASSKFHRITHANDPVPLLPPSEWGYSMHSTEFFISAPELPPSVSDIHRCVGDEDSACIAGNGDQNPAWGIPARFKLWQLFFAHRDYFWRLGLCVPGGDPKDWYRKYPGSGEGRGDGEVNEL